MNDVAVVTGATSGIGERIALGLARAGRHVVLVARDPGRAAATAQAIRDAVPAARPEIVLADLASLDAVRSAAAAIRARHPAIGLLVNNAGLFTDRRRLSPDGNEMTLAVNHLAPFALTTALLPALSAAAPARVVDIGSSSSDRARLDPTDLQLTRRWSILGAYARSKLALLTTSLERARRLDGTGVTVNVAHPGLVRTRIGAKGGLIGLGWRLATIRALTPEQGAVTPLHVALAADAAGRTGLYWKRAAPAAPNPIALDPDLVDALWRRTEALTASPNR